LLTNTGKNNSDKRSSYKTEECTFKGDIATSEKGCNSFPGNGNNLKNPLIQNIHNIHKPQDKIQKIQDSLNLVDKMKKLYTNIFKDIE